MTIGPHVLAQNYISNTDANSHEDEYGPYYSVEEDFIYPPDPDKCLSGDVYLENYFKLLALWAENKIGLGQDYEVAEQTAVKLCDKFEFDKTFMVAGAREVEAKADRVIQYLDSFQEPK